jgi:squalene cyclase
MEKKLARKIERTQKTEKEIEKAIKPKATPQMNSKSEQNQDGTYEFSTHEAVYKLFSLISKGMKEKQAAKKVAQEVWKDEASEYYRPMIIRKWADDYLDCGFIPKHRQGHHIKRLSVLSDPNVKEKAVAWLRKQDPVKRSIPAPP